MHKRFFSFFCRIGYLKAQWRRAKSLLVRRLRPAVLLTPLLLSGCMHNSSDRFYQPVEDVIPQSKVVDFRMAPCETLWMLDDSNTMSNGLYWLRAMDCADRMSAAQAHYQAGQLTSAGWANNFKQSILEASSDVDIAQRRVLLDKVNGYRSQIPGAIRPLLELWREHQSLLVSLEDEKARSARQQVADQARFEEMSNAQKVLQASLLDTRRKLENLTDIERQLSSRKQLQGELPDSDSTPASNGRSKNDAADTYVPAKATQSKATGDK
ncbi:MAG: two-component system QseEF-associated lipoprotein QseG [Rouxiella aceris]|uniref:two-component system QseEF-associated lipoprotein QseG n=1 Tax=Rouxiella aceris TaxID=2703884 RepID=UPI00284EDADA|nr:two-component system QseEF-associated lipoprotein QseG [Rouxiella aceris]MDR3434916.1 two-component system QseEF-associated lipoprotein QseG [Rouxiella aceris]